MTEIPNHIRELVAEPIEAWNFDGDDAVEMARFISQRFLASRTDSEAFLKELSHELRTQDNRITSDPLFTVQQKVRIYGVNPDYTDLHVWVKLNDPEHESSELESRGLDAISLAGGDIENWEKVGYVERWEFVTACFTEKGCRDYLKVNGHNLKEPRIYVESACGNREYNTVRETLLVHQQEDGE